MQIHPDTRDYVDRRTTQGLNKRDIMRCLKRYLAREMFSHVQAALRHRPLPVAPAPVEQPVPS